MKRILLLLLVVGLLSWKGLKKAEGSDESYVTIIFKNPQIKDTIFYNEKHYSIHENQIFYRLEGDFVDHTIPVSTKQKIVKIKTSKPIYLYHFYYKKDSYFNYYCFYPNDTLTFEYKEGMPYVESAKHKTLNYNYATFFNLKNPTDNDPSVFVEKFGRNKNEYELEAEQLANEKREVKLTVFLDSLKSQKSISEAGYNLNMSYFKNKEKLKASSPLELLKKPYNLADIGNSYLVYTAFEKIFRPKQLRGLDGTMPNYKEQFANAVALKNINIANRDYLMFTYLENMAKRDSKKNFLQGYAVFEKETKKESLKEYFKNKYPVLFEFDKNKENKEVLLFASNTRKKTLKEVLSQYKGRVVYVDFWASWCAPCRAVMPSSVKLHEEYKDKAVEFVYLSIDENAENWQKASVKEQLVDLQNNFLAINYPEANLYHELVLKTIPRYIIFDRNGNLVNPNGPSPDSAEIKLELERYLNE